MIKQIIILVAAFAVTVTGVSAYNSNLLNRPDVDLSDNQISALETVRELRAEGADRDEMHTILEAVGLDRDKMMELRTASHADRDARHEVIETALETGDYDTFLAAVANTPRADNPPTEADFNKLIKAHELREAGDYQAARAIMTELNIERGNGHGYKTGDRPAMHDGARFENKQMHRGNGDPTDASRFGRH